MSPFFDVNTETFIIDDSKHYFLINDFKPYSVNLSDELNMFKLVTTPLVFSLVIDSYNHHLSDYINSIKAPALFRALGYELIFPQYVPSYFEFTGLVNSNNVLSGVILELLDYFKP